MRRCAKCKTPLPMEYTSRFCSTKCSSLARMSTEERTAHAIADWLEARGDDRTPARTAQLIREGAWRKR